MVTDVFFFSYDIASPEFAQQLQPFLFEKTAHFVHEFVSFARAPCDMVAYDEKAEYDVPPDGAPLPELVPIENDEPGDVLCVTCVIASLLYRIQSFLNSPM